MIVDDEPFNLIALKAFLVQLGHMNVDTADDGQEALKMIIQNKADAKCGTSDHTSYKLLITDNQMPQMTGLELIERVHNLKNQNLMPKSLKLVLLSGDYHNLPLVEGIEKVYQKPITRVQLSDLLTRVELI